MKFRNFLEREDKEKIESISNVASDILKQLEIHYANLFDVYFPAPKQIKDHEKFMDWRSSCRTYEYQLPRYANRSFSIIGQSLQNLGGEYFDTRIHLYDNEFSKLHQELKNYHHSYEFNSRGTPIPRLKRENTKIKSEAKKVHMEMMRRFADQKETYFHTLFHEIVHLYDHDKLGDKFDKVTQNATDRLNKEIKIDPKNLAAIYNRIYMNNDVETNAWFLTNAHKTLKGQFSNFQDLVSNFKSHFANHWSILSQSNQRKMISRLYQLYF